MPLPDPEPVTDLAHALAILTAWTDTQAGQYRVDGTRAGVEVIHVDCTRPGDVQTVTAVANPGWDQPADIDLFTVLRAVATHSRDQHAGER
jgi:hypothetical protein